MLTDIKLTKEQLEQLNTARKAIEDLSNQQDKIYAETIKELNIEDDDFVFDYLMNGESLTYTAEELFEIIE
jgi:hypothetical protein